jgi:hypothetical protein
MFCSVVILRSCFGGLGIWRVYGIAFFVDDDAQASVRVAY